MATPWHQVALVYMDQPSNLNSDKKTCYHNSKWENKYIPYHADGILLPKKCWFG